MANEMQETRSQLPPEVDERLAKTLLAQQREAFERLIKIDEQLSKTNFLTNGAAAIAVLAFIGSEHASLAMAIPLAIFSIGVIATACELRALLYFSGSLFQDARRRHLGYLDDKLTVAELTVPKDIARRASQANAAFGWIAQSAFVVGVIVSGVLFVCYPSA